MLRAVCCAALAMAACASTVAQSTAPFTPTLSAEDFARRPKLRSPAFSPDGERFAAVQDVGGRMNLVAADTKARKLTRVTAFTSVDVSSYRWISNTRIVFAVFDNNKGLTEQRGGGLFAVNFDGSEPKELSPTAKDCEARNQVCRQTRFFSRIAGSEDEIIAIANERDLETDDLYRLNTRTGRKTLLDLGGSVETDGLPRRRFGGEGGRGAEALVQGKPAKNAKRNWRRLNDMFGAVAVRRAEDAAMIGAWIDVFRAQKAERFAELGIADAFAPAGTREFLLAASDPSMPGGPVLEIHALLGGETVLAVAGIVAGRRRRSCVFLSDMAGTVKSMAPGVLMMNEMGIGAAAAGADSYDAGIGLQAYKMAICDTVDPVFETCRGYSPLGRLAVAAMQVKADAKRRVKQSPMLWSVVTRLRKLRSRDIRAEDRSAAAEEG